MATSFGNDGWRPDALLLDAGNTILFIDHGVMSDVLGALGYDVSAAALRSTQRAANLRYVEQLRDDGDHDDAWRVFMQRWVSANPELVDAIVCDRA
jgi:hypothetical protein